LRSVGKAVGQIPWLDDNGDGASTKHDGDLAKHHVLGRYPAFGLTPPTILQVATTTTVAVNAPVALWAQMDPSVAARRVWAIIVPDYTIYAGTEPVTDFTTVELAPSATPNRWEATWRPGYGFAGRCSVTYFAESEDSLNTRLAATPVASGLIVDATAVRIPWEILE
jgi:hypothetical protein